MGQTVRRLAKNYFALNTLQIANYLLPVITLPYIVRVIGAELYGSISFAQAIVHYFTLIVQYSFDYSVTREISAHRHDVKYVSKLFYTVVATKLFLCVVTIIPFLILISFVPKFQTNFVLYIVVFLINFGYALFPVFYFQGIEKLSRVATFNLFIKIFFTLGVFIFLRSESDYLIVPLSHSLGQIVIGGIAFSYAIISGSLGFSFVTFKEIVMLLKHGFKLFASSVVVSLYTTTNTVLLGILTNDTIVGYYAAAEKIEALVERISLNPLVQILYPFFSKAFHNDKKKASEYLEKALIWIPLVCFFISLALMLSAPLIVKIVFGVNFAPAIPVLMVLAWLLFMRSINNISAIQGLMNLKMDKEFLQVTLIGMFLCISLNFLLVPLWSAVGTATAWIITELFIVLASMYILIKKQIVSFTVSKIKTIIRTKFNV